MNNKGEISVQYLFNTANELPQRVTEMKLLCTIAPDIFQCDHPFPGPNITSCTQHSRRPKVTCLQEFSAQSVICCPLRSSSSRPHQDRPLTSHNPTEKKAHGHPRSMDMETVVHRMQCVFHEKSDHIEGSPHPSPRI
ncbi:hypothetical protein AVEN_166309-1 [Araneus ventricosus]|uniref:Uncharacterized protein n=1 Tax=Araneus ventricosus TaxID=182803 RepID=A0A4Y2LD57_ARAVE|nr:hypothetical protein AVEN_166309-1 [Araneus ventricosus]